MTSDQRRITPGTVEVPAPLLPAPGLLPEDTGHGAAAEPYAGVRVPATAATVAEWAGIWVSMCADGDLVFGPLTDELARGGYDLSAKQLRNIRHAATSGALRRRAEELGVRLPAGYVDVPTSSRINGHAVVGAPR